MINKSAWLASCQCQQDMTTNQKAALWSYELNLNIIQNRTIYYEITLLTKGQQVGYNPSISQNGRQTLNSFGHWPLKGVTIETAWVLWHSVWSRLSYAVMRRCLKTFSRRFAKSNISSIGHSQMSHQKSRVEQQTLITLLILELFGRLNSEA